jgi:GAF domain-containing protein
MTDRGVLDGNTCLNDRVYKVSASGPRPNEELAAGISNPLEHRPVDGASPDGSVSGVARGLAGLDEVAWNSLDQLSRALRVEEGNLETTLAAILVAAVDLIDGANAAGLNLLVKKKFVPQVVFGAAPPLLDELQQRTERGPCVEASREQHVVDLADTRTDARWPEFTEMAVELGVLSMLCVPLWVDERKLGSLSLYSSEPHAFDQTAARLANLYATHAALALADAQRVDQLHRVVTNRDLIGQAKGILMATQRITADDAFALLTNASQRLNRKLVDIAEVVATTGALPSR